MISYDKLFALMKSQGKTQKNIRDEKICGQETLRKLKKGSGLEETYNYKDPKTGKVEERIRITSIDSTTIESFCKWLNCQPGDLMEYTPNDQYKEEK